MFFTTALVLVAHAFAFHVTDVAKNSVRDLKQFELRDVLLTNKQYSSHKVVGASSTKYINSTNQDNEYGLNSLLKAVHLAFAGHHGLTLSPEVLYVAIVQGLSAHINMDPEKHRKAAGIAFEGKVGLKLDLRVHRQVRTWEDAFTHFSSEIGKWIPKDLEGELKPTFTTATPLSTAVTAMTIMDVYKGYFEYSIGAACGIPEITLEGSPQDWILLQKHAKQLLARFEGTEAWSAQLDSVLAQFVRASQNDVDAGFWQKIYKYTEKFVCFPAGVSGWINVFFPYVGRKQLISNHCLDWKSCMENSREIVPALFPSGTTNTPFTWVARKKETEMQLLAGIVGIDKLKNNHLKPNLGWAVLAKKA